VIVALTGASGLLGGNVATLLVAEGHTVRCTRRGRSRTDHLAHLPLDWRDAGLDDLAKLTRVFDGAEVVVHVAGSTRPRRKPTPDLIAANVDGVRNVIHAVRAVGGPRLLHVSSTSAVGVSDDGDPIDETAPWNLPAHGLADGYAITKRRGEELALAAGIDVVVVNPGFLFGPLDVKPTSGRMIRDVALGRGWVATRGRNNFVDVRDVARGAWAAAQRGRRGERYILGGDNLTYAEVFTLIAEVTGARPPRLVASAPLARVVGWAGDLRRAVTGRDPAITTQTIRWGLEPGFVFRSDKARAELGYTTGDLRVAIADAWEWMRRASGPTAGPRR
jgi:dihydroflavonol-4-reductase